VIIDPFADVIAECRTLVDVITATLIEPNWSNARDARYKKARRPESRRKAHKALETKLHWMNSMDNQPLSFDLYLW